MGVRRAGLNATAPGVPVASAKATAMMPYWYWTSETRFTSAPLLKLEPQALCAKPELRTPATTLRRSHHTFRELISKIQC